MWPEIDLFHPHISERARHHETICTELLENSHQLLLLGSFRSCSSKIYGFFIRNRRRGRSCVKIEDSRTRELCIRVVIISVGAPYAVNCWGFPERYYLFGR